MYLDWPMKVRAKEEQILDVYYCDVLMCIMRVGGQQPVHVR